MSRTHKNIEKRVYLWKRTHVQREKRKREYAERVRREFMAGEGFDYLCQIKGVKSGIILAESMSDHMKAELVVKTI